MPPKKRPVVRPTVVRGPPSVSRGAKRNPIKTKEVPSNEQKKTARTQPLPAKKPPAKKFKKGKRNRSSTSSGSDGGMSDPSDCIRGENGEDWEGPSGQWTSTTEESSEESEEESEEKVPHEKYSALKPIDETTTASEDISTNSS